MKTTISSSALIYLVILLMSPKIFAEEYYWTAPSFSEHYSSPHEACLAEYVPAKAQLAAAFVNLTYPIKVDYDGSWTAGCYAHTGSYLPGAAGHGYGLVLLRGNSCPQGKKFNLISGECDIATETQPPEPKGPCTTAGNPIDILTGRKLQTENILEFPVDISIAFTKIGNWEHSYSSFLLIRTSTITRYDPFDGYSNFTRSQNTAQADSGDQGQLTNTGQYWSYQSKPGQIDTYSNQGLLISRQTTKDGLISISRPAGNQIRLTKEDGTIVDLYQDSSRQLLKVQAPSFIAEGTYNDIGQLQTLSYFHGGGFSQRHYHYEDTSNPRLLTGITDESGVRLASWAYDSQGRAISSEHANGAEKTLLTYNADGSATVTNAYGKKTTYKFQFAGGIKRISSIEGEPTANCPYSNSTFTYDNRGLLRTLTDAKGNVTTYEYNSRDLEVRRTNGAGTPLARTVETKWHPTQILKTEVTEPNRITTYQYDAQGRPLGQTVTPR